jgi:hypothetical protein
MAAAILEKRQARANAGQLMAVLDLMLGFLDSSKSGKMFRPAIGYHRPAPMYSGK